MDREYGTDYESLYENHWWWRSRERILTQAIRSLDLAADAEIVDVGCGNGLFLSRLSEFGSVKGIEVDEQLLDDRNPFRDCISTAPLGAPAYKSWQCDLITACDVIEHIQDDDCAVREMVTMLRPGGYLLITVPAFRLLWDHHDEMNHHFRRYRLEELASLLLRHIPLCQCRYLFHGIFLPKLIVKCINASRHRKVVQHRLPSAWVNHAMQSLCYAEYRLTERAQPPFGTSVLAIARKPN